MSQPDQLLKHFELARRDLLELSTANRMLSTPREQHQGASIEIVDESSAEVFRMLVREGSTMRFEEGVIDESASPAKQVNSDPAESPSQEQQTVLPKPVLKRRTKKKAAEIQAALETSSGVPTRDTKTSASETDDTGKGSAVSTSDDVLHTILAPEELDRRLVSLMDDATTLMQEQGVNVLYLAVGFLRWREPDAPDTPRDAPLILIPVSLERGRAGHRYSLTWDEGEISTNLTLKTRMKVDFGIEIPELPETEELSPVAYFQDVEKAIAGQRGWEVRRDEIVLWCFSFTKLLMYRDLDPENWPADKRLEDRPLIRALLQDGFPPVEPLCKSNDNIDSLFDAAQTMHVIDCDSSQALVVEEASRGRNLVIQGPPGTGKSQTISNLIAAAVTSGKTILFVAEKMAALEVVKRRLDNIGIGDMCLELHSKMSNKKVVLQEVDRTLKLGGPSPSVELPDVIKRLKERQATLNSYANVIHTPFQKSGQSPYQILSELIELRATSTPLPDFQLPEAADWSADEFSKKLEAVTDLSHIIKALGDPAQHPWRGSNLDQILPLDLERLLVAAPQRVTDLDALTESVGKLTQRLADDPATSLALVERILLTVAALMKAPELDPQPMGGTMWTDHRKAIHELADYSRAILTAREKLDGKVTEAAWDKDVAADLQAYGLYGKSMFRMFRSSYRQARHTLKSVLTGSQPATFEERLEVLDLLNKRQTARKKLAEAATVGEKAFGRFWLGSQTDWKRIAEWEAWDESTSKAGASPRFRSMLSLIDHKDEIQQLADDVRRKLEVFQSGYKALCESLKLDLAVAFGRTTTETAVSKAASVTGLGPAVNAPLEEIRERLVAWTTSPEGLQHWQTYRRSSAAASTIGKGALVERITSGKIAPADGPAVFRFARAEALLRAMFKQHPDLETFDGGKFEELIEEFCNLDIRRLELARTEVADAHWQGIGRQRGEGMSEAVALLKHEMQKQRRHLPLRELLARAGKAVQAVKPVFMMSPLSVAQYLTPGVLEFDMLLIDEASQVRPVEALGAAARCRQMVVVGDDKQMPPTQFFGKVLGDVADDRGPEMQAGDVESILGLAIARNTPQRMLRWHYRSKHESLIAVSNREFYESQLYVVPSPERSGELGVKWNFVEGGKFVKGKNDVEAKVVAEAIMKHAREHAKWTLGVAAFSVSQRDAILKELELLRKKSPQTESFFDPNAPDPFFIKNLENVQGDERDVIIVSVGYGPGEDGKVSLNFGPVSSSGGERRLNVLMTRAKRVLHMFSSMHAEDIDLSRATGRGPAVFREYLRFAQQGSPTDSIKTNAGRDRFVEVLQRQLTERGYKVQAQVGVAGLFVDLAVVDPDNPNRYVLGITVDGETFRTARSSRDRNRTTDGVLNGQGWILHRIWSLEWFKRPTEQLNKLIEMIESARKGQARKKDARLASTVSTISRQAGGPDPLSAATGRMQPLPPRATRPEDPKTESGSLFSDIVSTGLKVGAAVLVAEKGKGLDAAIDMLGKDPQDSKDQKKSRK
jgi:very-short-patch-repair endonuclease